MKPIDFEGSNHAFGAPADMTNEECGTLPVCNDGEYNVSCWELSDDDMMDLAKHRKIWLGVRSGMGHPVVFLSPLEPYQVSRSKSDKSGFEDVDKG